LGLRDRKKRKVDETIEAGTFWYVDFGPTPLR